MQEILICEPVIPNLPLTIECFSGYFVEERVYRVFLSTKEGHLLIYKVTRLKGDPVSKLERTIKLKTKSKIKLILKLVFEKNFLRIFFCEIFF